MTNSVLRQDSDPPQYVAQPDCVSTRDEGSISSSPSVGDAPDSKQLKMELAYHSDTNNTSSSEPNRRVQEPAFTTSSGIHPSRQELINKLSHMEPNTTALLGIHPSRLQLLNEQTHTDDDEPWNVVRTREYFKMRGRQEVAQRQGLNQHGGHLCSGFPVSMDRETYSQTGVRGYNSDNFDKGILPGNTSQHRVESCLTPLVRRDAYLGPLYLAFELGENMRLRKTLNKNMRRETRADSQFMLQNNHDISLIRELEDQAAKEVVSFQDLLLLLQTYRCKETQKFITMINESRSAVERIHAMSVRLAYTTYPNPMAALKDIIDGQAIIEFVYNGQSSWIMDSSTRSSIPRQSAMLHDHMSRHAMQYGILIHEVEDVYSALKKVRGNQHAPSWTLPVRGAASDDVNNADNTASTSRLYGSKMWPITVIDDDAEPENSRHENQLAETSLFVIDSDPSPEIIVRCSNFGVAEVDVDHHVLGLN